MPQDRVMSDGTVSDQETLAELRSTSSYFIEAIAPHFKGSRPVNLTFQKPSRFKEIYYLKSRQRIIALLKIFDDEEEYQRELDGMEYASCTGLPVPRVYHSSDASNPISRPLVIREYFELFPVMDLIYRSRAFQGSIIDEAFAENYFQRALDLIVSFHKASGQDNDLYGRDDIDIYKFGRLFDRLKAKIDVATGRIPEAIVNDHRAFLQDVVSYYANNLEVFMDTPGYHTHNDLDFPNIGIVNPRTCELIIMDFEKYSSRGDCAKDVALFVEKNYWIKRNKDKVLDRIDKIYVDKDGDFQVRRRFWTAIALFTFDVNNQTVRFSKEYIKKYI